MIFLGEAVQEIIMIDFEPLRFSYEEKLLRAAANILGSNALMGRTMAKHLLDARRKDLLGDAVRITPDLLPEVHRVYRSCLDVLDSDLVGDLFVIQSRDYNASVFAHEKKFDVLVHSALLNDFDMGELRFVFGHELGHVVFEHSRLPVHDILSKNEKLSPRTANLLFRWSRAAEVSADRIGLMCCGQLTPAVSALFKTSSGLAGIDVDRVLRSFRSQYEELEHQIREVGDNRDWVRTHPMIPIRFKALELAALDIGALRRNSKGFSWKGFRSIDSQISFILETIEGGS